MYKSLFLYFIIGIISLLGLYCGMVYVGPFLIEYNIPHMVIDFLSIDYLLVCIGFAIAVGAALDIHISRLSKTSEKYTKEPILVCKYKDVKHNRGIIVYKVDDSKESMVYTVVVPIEYYNKNIT